ncbi:uncharacterized protein KIAA0513-like [Amphibalanus amphitrite]|uniref:uncharacterized protein KIAA0513-like n=1 Tax=Amphibalanus amphitrite TaxID=1232801 RepID=UPI001C907DAB|nr:uncharacterized protein KIAA0513-like [Amphibalanus amphitrite]
MVDLLRGSAAARGLAGRTQGALRSRLRSMVDGSDRLIQGLSSKLEDGGDRLMTRLETALSLSSGADSDASGATVRRTDDSGDSDAAADGLLTAGDGHLLSAGDGPSSACSRESLASSGSRWSADRPLRATGPDPYDKLRTRCSDVASTSESASEGDGYGPSTSLELSEDKRRPWPTSDSEGSLRSVSSDLSGESGADSDPATAESRAYIRQFVDRLFSSSADISLEEKARFGELMQTESGRAWFARLVNHQRGRHRCVPESTFYSLVQYFALALFECGQAEDYAPAKSLMNMCFTFYHKVGSDPSQKQYLYELLGQQPIWRSVRFWNAAFFDALQTERSHRPVPTRQQLADGDVTGPADDVSYQQNITFGQLGTFTHNMFSLGLPRELCLEFLRKQSAIANLREDQLQLLRDNIDTMYDGSARLITTGKP